MHEFICRFAFCRSGRIESRWDPRTVASLSGLYRGRVLSLWEVRRPSEREEGEQPAARAEPRSGAAGVPRGSSAAWRSAAVLPGYRRAAPPSVHPRRPSQPFREGQPDLWGSASPRRGVGTGWALPSQSVLSFNYFPASPPAYGANSLLTAHPPNSP